jgi:hypothetical protein
MLLVLLFFVDGCAVQFQFRGYVIGYGRQDRSFSVSEFSCLTPTLFQFTPSSNPAPFIRENKKPPHLDHGQKLTLDDTLVPVFRPSLFSCGMVHLLVHEGVIICIL